MERPNLFSLGPVGREKCGVALRSLERGGHAGMGIVLEGALQVLHPPDDPHALVDSSRDHRPFATEHSDLRIGPPSSVPDPLPEEIVLAPNAVSRRGVRLVRNSLQLGRQLGCDPLVGVEPKDPIPAR
jgi:hypothetical protein